MTRLSNQVRVLLCGQLVSQADRRCATYEQGTEEAGGDRVVNFLPREDRGTGAGGGRWRWHEPRLAQHPSQPAKPASQPSTRGCAKEPRALVSSLGFGHLHEDAHRAPRTTHAHGHSTTLEPPRPLVHDAHDRSAVSKGGQPLRSNRYGRVIAMATSASATFAPPLMDEFVPSF